MDVGSPRFAALSYKNFRVLWSGLIVSNMGTWMQNVASGWLVLQLTNSPLWLGLLGFSFAVPMVILPPFAGAVVDRVHRIRLLFFTQSMQMLNVLVLALLTWSGRVEVWHILVNAFVGAVLLAFDNPARQALFPDLVAPRDLLNALSLNSATYTGAALVGPGMTGMVKEEILTRQTELGYSIENGSLVFDFLLLDRNEFLAEPTTFEYSNVHGGQERIGLPANSIAYTICQVPVVLQPSEAAYLTVHLSEGSTEQITGYVLDHVNTRHIFQRDGLIHHLVVSIPPSQ